MKSSGFSTEELARKFFDGWKNSPPHRENMLNAELTEMGIAIGYSPKSNRYYAVQELGRPHSVEIHFEVANHTGDTLRYVIRWAATPDEQPEPIELPPWTRMFHTRCRASLIDWGWTRDDDRVPAENGAVFTIEKAEGGYKIVRGELKSAGGK
jgi:hypothetical protein